MNLRILFINSLSKYPLESIDRIALLIEKYPTFIIRLLKKYNVIPQLLQLLSNNDYNFKYFMIRWLKYNNYNYTMPSVIINIIDKYTKLPRINDKLQLNITFILNYIATYGTYDDRKYIINSKIIPILMNNIFNNTSFHVKYFSVQTFGNLMQNLSTTHYVNLLIKLNLLSNLLLLAQTIQKLYHIQKLYQSNKYLISELSFTIIFTLENICRSNYILNDNEGIIVIHILEILLKFINKTKVINLLNTIYWLAKYKKMLFADLLISTGLIKHCSKHLTFHNETIFKRSMYCIYQITFTSSNHRLIIFNILKILKKLQRMLTDKKCNKKHKIKTIILWYLSQLTSSYKINIYHLTRYGLIKIIVKNLNSKVDTISQQALEGICHAISYREDIKCSYNQFSYIMKLNIIRYLCKFLKTTTECRQLQVLLYGLEGIFKHEELYIDKHNRGYRYRKEFQHYGGLKCLILLFNNFDLNYITPYLRNQIEYLLLTSFNIININNVNIDFI